jgi:hypothetical protein
MPHLRLTIDVWYDLNTESQDTVIKHLEQLPMFLAGEGLLSGDTDALVDEWKSGVEVVV